MDEVVNLVDKMEDNEFNKMVFGLEGEVSPMRLVLKRTSFRLRLPILTFPGRHCPGVHIVLFLALVYQTGTAVADFP